MTELLPTPRLPSPGEVIERYQVVGRIAQGGMAEVYLARRRGPGGFEKRVAMKVMHAHLAGEPNFVSMFLDEARIASSIEHPNVVRVLDVGLHEGLPWLVMELLHGEPLTMVVADEATMPDMRLSIGILLATAEGLHAAHEARGADGRRLDVVHRDVSPHNIHVGYDGHVKVVDFGIAAAEGRLTRTATGEVKGKFGYLAPEQIKYPGLRVDRRVDLWAFGVVAWELFARRRLFGAGDAASKLYQILNAPIPSVRTVAPDAPETVASVIDACLSRDPDLRPNDAAAIATALRDAIAEDHATLRGDLADHMERRFGERRKKSEAMLELFHLPKEGNALPSAEAASGELTLPDLGAPDGDTTVSATDVARRARRNRWLAIASLPLLAFAAIAIASSLDHGTALHEPAAGAEPPPVGSAAPTLRTRAHDGAGHSAAETAGTEETAVRSPPAPAPATIETIRVSIGPRVRLVRVDGEIHAERPLVLAVPEDGTVDVELVGARGRTARRELHAADDGLHLDLPRPRPNAGRRDDLMESPY